MTTIRIDNEVYAALEQSVRSFGETPNAVLRRMLGLERENKFRVSDGQAVYMPWLTGFRAGRPVQSEPRQTAQSLFTLPILEAIHEMGGEGRAKEVLDDVGRRLGETLFPADFELLSNGEPRWRVTAAFERQNLIERGLLDREAARGVWRITERGKALLARRSGADAPEGWDLGLGLAVTQRVIRENKEWLREMASR